MKQTSISRFNNFLTLLEGASISYSLAHHRKEALMAIVSVPGERWEVEFLEDGSVEVERFKSNGHIDDVSALTELFEHFSDKKNTASESLKTAKTEPVRAHQQHQKTKKLGATVANAVRKSSSEVKP